MNTPKNRGEFNERKGKQIMKNLYTKKTMNINFNKKNKMAIARKFKKENLYFASLMSEAQYELRIY